MNRLIIGAGDVRSMPTHSPAKEGIMHKCSHRNMQTEEKTVEPVSPLRPGDIPLSALAVSSLFGRAVLPHSLNPKAAQQRRPTNFVTRCMGRVYRNMLPAFSDHQALVRMNIIQSCYSIPNESLTRTQEIAPRNPRLLIRSHRVAWTTPSCTCL